MIISIILTLIEVLLILLGLIILLESFISHDPYGYRFVWYSRFFFTISLAVNFCEGIVRGFFQSGFVGFWALIQVVMILLAGFLASGAHALLVFGFEKVEDIKNT